jgi:serine/threonine protein kinase
MDMINFDLDYKFTRPLDEGGQGSTTLYHHKVTRKAVVLKKSLEGNLDFDDEPEILQKLNHPNIISCLGASKDCMVVEYCDLGDLWNYRESKLHRGPRVPESFIWSVYQQLSRALAYLHEGYGTEHYKKGSWKPVYHRDIKPANVFIQSIPGSGAGPVTIKLADFGGAAMKDVVPNHMWDGTEDWTPPEFPVWGPAADVWAVGAIVHYLALGKPPDVVASAGFTSINVARPRVAASIDVPHLTYDHLGKYRPALNRLMNAALTADLDKRYSAVELTCILDEILEPALAQCSQNVDVTAWDEDHYPDLPDCIEQVMEEYATEVRKPSSRFEA